MADAELEARLRSHSKAFEGLMSLIPANVYYAPDTSDQWQRKKQTKEQKRAAKKAKLDPASNKSALDVQNERKRKRDEEASEVLDHGLSADGIQRPATPSAAKDLPGKKRKANDGSAVEKQKPASDVPLTEEQEARRQSIIDKKRAKRERKKEQREKEREKKAVRKEGVKKAKAAQRETKGVTLDTEEGATAKVPSSKSTGKKEKSNEVKRNKAQKVARTPKNTSAPKNLTKTQLAAEEASSDEDADEIDESELLKLDGLVDSDSEVESELDADKTTADTLEEITDDEFKDNDLQDNPDEDEENEDEGADENHTSSVADEMDTIKLDGFVDEDAVFSSSETSPSNDPSPTFDHSHSSSISSTSSMPVEQPPIFKSKLTKSTDSEDPAVSVIPRPTKAPKLPKIDPQILQSRLTARLAALRAARNADGPDGKPARNRQELIDTRRRKTEARKAHKKELRAKARADGTQDAEAEAARLRGGSGSPLVVGSPVHENSFSFGRVAFDDGTQMDAGLSDVLPERKKKGPQDPRTALEAAKAKAARIGSFDAAKRADIEEKDRWLHAKKRAQGERLRDDTSLLKKTLKRMEKGKAKSEKEWGERIEGVQKGKEARQKKRDENIRKRREEKGGKGGKGGKGAAKGGPKGAGVKKKRPGFEGTFRSGGGRKA